MFDNNLFRRAVEILNRNPLNDEQEASVLYDWDKPLFIVAGPGTGKTTVLTYRILKFVFVDGIKPNRIIATTFTVKAANELRSRILEKGIEMTKLLPSLNTLTHKQENYLDLIDFNQIKTGTLDSIAEELLTEYRSLDELTPVIIDDIISKAYFLKHSIFNSGAYKDKKLKDYIKGKLNLPFINVSGLRDYIQMLYEKIYHEDIDIDEYIENIDDPIVKGLETQIKGMIDEYTKSIWDTKNLYDFTRLEYRLLEKIMDNSLGEFIDNYDLLLVDEYQDTNYLQEQIYFNIIRKIRDRYPNTGNINKFAPITVVGDDDQSLYRFRGSVVQLFRDFSKFFNQEFNIFPEIKFLITNYRSSKKIIDFYNEFLKLDENYLDYARVKDKDFVNNDNFTSPPEDFPILCLFRDNTEELAKDFAQFIWDIYRGNGREIRFKDKGYLIKGSLSGGDIGDTVLLMSSPREKGSFGTQRFPYFLRHELEELNIKVFNPRGEEVATHKDFQILAGLILLCLDPDLRIQNSQKFFTEVLRIFEQWRNKGEKFIENYKDHGERRREDLGYYVDCWSRRYEALNEDWDIPLLDLVYELIYWIEDFIEEPEHQLYLELLTRTIAQSASYASYGARIVKQKDNPRKQDWQSVTQLFWNIFVPIAAGEIFINEELIDQFPRDRLNILSIHQSKGLEFPMVIVDISTDFKRKHPAHRFKRFPDKGSKTHILEQEYRKYSAIKEFIENRDDPVDRAFDDLIRKFYVAFSRAQEIILLIGLNASLDNRIPNVALGWTRSGDWKWEDYHKTWILI